MTYKKLKYRKNYYKFMYESEKDFSKSVITSIRDIQKLKQSFDVLMIDKLQERIIDLCDNELELIVAWRKLTKKINLLCNKK